MVAGRKGCVLLDLSYDLLREREHVVFKFWVLITVISPVKSVATAGGCVCTYTFIYCSLFNYVVSNGMMMISMTIITH